MSNPYNPPDPGQGNQNPGYGNQNPGYGNPNPGNPNQPAGYANPTSPYGSPYPAYGGPGNTMAVAPRTPGTVNGAFGIYVLTAIIAVVGIIVSVNSSIWDDAVRAAGGSAVTLNISTLKTVAIFVGAIFAALFLFFAFMMRAGRNWARIVLTVLSALSLLSAFNSRASVTVNGQTFQSSSSQLTSWIGVILAILAIVLMYLPASNAYFTASKAARRRP